MLALTLMMGNLWAQADADPADPGAISEPAKVPTAVTPTNPKDVDNSKAEDSDAVKEAGEEAGFGGDSGDTAWMIVATALVLFMTIPGLSLFYGGLARRKNVLSILVNCYSITCMMTLLWTYYVLYLIHI